MSRTSILVLGCLLFPVLLLVSSLTIGFTVSVGDVVVSFMLSAFGAIIITSQMKELEKLKREHRNMFKRRSRINHGMMKWLSYTYQRISVLIDQNEKSRKIKETDSSFKREFSFPFNINIEVNGDEGIMELEKEMLYFKIAEEWLSVIKKYADATAVLIILSYRPDCFKMMIVDNGKWIKKRYTYDASVSTLNVMSESVDGTLDITAQNNLAGLITLYVPNRNQLLASNQ